MAGGEIGRVTPVYPLNLITGDDFKWSYKWDGGFPDGSELYLEFLNGPGNKAKDKWPFAISGPWASLRVQSDVCDSITPQTGYRLVYRNTTVVPSDESVIQYGAVKRWEP
ncbi:hypothetical protein [Nocardia sp. NPDC052566]|uniref:LtfC-like domain-containing protein n=1 Tax=Nocardia sp. NPDC052566 TaxID=3364330 RepID=UPI0037CCBE6C